MIPMDDGACGYFRVREPARVAAAAGVDVKIMADHAAIPDKYRGLPVRTVWDPRAPNGRGGYGVDVITELLVDADVLVVQRPLMQPMHSVAIQAKKQGIKVVVELDDDLHAVHRRNTVAGAVDPRKQPFHNVQWAARTIDLADMLICSTPAIANRYGPHKAVVVRNYLPEHILPLAPDVSPAREVVGWTGSVNVHPEDLQETGGGVRLLSEPFTVVGMTRGVAKALRLPDHMVRLGAPWQDSIPAYWAKVAECIGVGIAPLQQSAFNRAKSWLKPFEFMALGIPCVASPLPEYLRLAAESGAVQIAKSRGQWQRMVTKLLDSDVIYNEQRAAGLAWAKEHTLERHIGEHIQAWEKACAL